MTHVIDRRPVDGRPGAVIGRGALWGLAGGAVCGAVAVSPAVLANGPAAALLIYPVLAAVVGSVVGLVIGLVTAFVFVCAPPATPHHAAELGGLVALLAVGWTAVVFAWIGIWFALLAATAGALLGPRVSARRSGAATAGGRASPGWSRAPGR